MLEVPGIALAGPPSFGFPARKAAIRMGPTDCPKPTHRRLFGRARCIRGAEASRSLDPDIDIARRPEAGQVRGSWANNLSRTPVDG